MGTRGFLAAKFKIAAPSQLVKLFSRKRRAVEEFLSRQYKINEEVARKRFIRDMDFETKASEPAVMSAVVITKSNRNERGLDELRNGDWWTNHDERIPKLGRSLFQEKAEGVSRHVSIYSGRNLKTLSRRSPLAWNLTRLHLLPCWLFFLRSSSDGRLYTHRRIMRPDELFRSASFKTHNQG